MSRLRQTKIATPSNPPTNTEELYYDTAGPGFNTPVALCSRDESGNIAMLAHYAVLDYRFIKVTVVTASGAGTWTPANGCRLAFVECVGAGGQGGGAATSSTQVSVGGGGGGGAYAAKTLTGSGIKSTSYTNGAKGSGAAAGATGTVGADTTWDTTVIVAKGGAGGPVMAAGTTVIDQIGGAGGAAASCTGDIKLDGSAGQTAMRFSTTTGYGGDGGAAAVVGVSGGQGRASASGGAAGGASAAGAYGSGGGGAGTSSTSAAGGAGMDGLIRIWEYA